MSIQTETSQNCLPRWLYALGLVVVILGFTGGAPMQKAHAGFSTVAKQANTSLSPIPIGVAFKITPTYDGNTEWTNPRVVYNTHDQEYLAVFEIYYKKDPSFRKVIAQKISKSGQLLGDTISICGNQVCQSPDVAYDSTSNSYIVVWEQPDINIGGTSILGSIVSAAGQVFDSVTIASSGGTAWTEAKPAVTTITVLTATYFFVVWEETIGVAPGIPVNIKGQAISSTGGLHGSWIMISQDPGDGISHRHNPDVVNVAIPNDNRLFVTWRQCTNSSCSSSEVYGRQIGSDGRTIGPVMIDFGLTSDIPVTAFLPTETHLGRGQILVAMGFNQDILAKTLGTNESSPGAYITVDDPDVQSLPNVVGDPVSMHYLMAWPQSQANGWAVKGYSVNTVQANPGNAFIANDYTYHYGWDVKHVAVAPGRGSFLVVYDDWSILDNGYQIYGQFWTNSILYLPLVQYTH